MLRCYYDPSHSRWIIDSAAVLSPEQIAACSRHTLFVQKQRHAGMTAGDKREVVGRSIVALEQGRIFRRPVPKTLEREATVFASTPGTGKIIVGA